MPQGRDAAGRFTQGESLGGLVVEMLFDDSQFADGVKHAIDSVKALGDQLSSFSNEAFERILQGAAASLLAVGAASVYVGSSFEKEISKVGALAGATAADLDRLSDAAREMGANTAFSATEAAQAMESLAQAGLATDDIIRGTEAALALAAASGSDLASATSIMAATFSTFGEPTTEAGRIADVFAETLNASQLNMEGLTGSMQYAGPAAAAFGYSLEETAASISLFSNLGIEGAKAGTTFRMALSQAANVSNTGAAALAKYGLTAKDISPEFHSFGEILKTVGENGITASDAMLIFGTESGGAIATLGEQAVSTRTELSKTYDGILADLQNSQGTAEETATRMLDNVAGAFGSASGAGEEFLLTLYDTYAKPLSKLLLQVADFIKAVTREFKLSSDVLSDGIGGENGVLTMVTEWLAQNENRIAKMAVVWAERFMEVARTVAALLPILETVVELMGAIWVTTQVLEFAQALHLGALAWDAMTIAAEAFGVTLAEETAGIYLLVVAVGIMVTAIAAYTASNYEAEASAERLTAAQLRQQAINDTGFAKDVGAMRNRLLAQQAYAREVLESGEQISDVRRQELNRILDLDASQAVLLVRSGELIDTGNELRTVQSLVNESMDTADTSALTDAQARLAAQQKELEAQATDLGHALDGVNAAAREGQDANEAWRYIAQTTDVATDSLEDARVKYDEINRKLAEVKDAQAAIANESTRTKSAILSDAQAEVDAHEKLKRQFVSVAAKQSEASDATEVTAEKVTEVSGAIEEQTDLYKRLASQSVSSQTIQVEWWNKSAYAEVDATLAADEARAEASRNEKKRRKVDLNEALDSYKRLVDGATDAAKKIGSAISGALGMFTGLLKSFTGFSFSLSDAIGSVVAGNQSGSGGASAARDFVKNLIKESRAWLDALVASLPAIITALADGIPTLIGAIVDAIPRIVDALADGIPHLIERVVNAIPGLVSALLGAIPVIVSAILDSLPDIVAGLVGAAADLIVKVARMLPKLVTTILEALPEIIQSLIVSLALAIPEIVVALVTAIPKILVAVLTAIPEIVVAVVDMIPLLVTSLIGMIPDIIVALANALPDLVPAIITLIPRIWIAIILAIPKIVFALVRALVVEIIFRIPEIMVAVGKGLIEAIVNAFKAIGSVISDAIKDALHIGGGNNRNDGTRTAGDGADSSARTTSGSGSSARSGGTSVTHLSVGLDGYVVDEAMFAANSSGRATKLAGSMRRSAGVKVGFDRGKFNPY